MCIYIYIYISHIYVWSKYVLLYYVHICDYINYIVIIPQARAAPQAQHGEDDDVGRAALLYKYTYKHKYTYKQIYV